MGTQLHITAADNELYILASQAVGSSELCHLKSGFNAQVDDTFDLNNILPHGKYDLTFVGINWGGPWNFNIVTNNLGTLHSNGNGAAGVVWQKTVQVTVP